MEKLLLDGKWNCITRPSMRERRRAQAVKEDRPIRTLRRTYRETRNLTYTQRAKHRSHFWGTNLYAFRPYEFYEWWYTRTFVAPQALGGSRRGAVPGRRGHLFDGVSNGTAVGETNDMMLEYRFRRHRSAAGG
jgi:beta-mannosidase